MVINQLVSHKPKSHSNAAKCHFGHTCDQFLHAKGGCWSHRKRVAGHNWSQNWSQTQIA